MECQCEIVHTYQDSLAGINKIYLLKTDSKLSALQHCHLAILASSKRFYTKTRVHKTLPFF